MVKVTVPVGRIGENATPPSCAVKTTDVPTLKLVEGTADKVNEGESDVTVCTTGTRVISPEPVS
jgi:hypothetical protein